MNVRLKLYSLPIRQKTAVAGAVCLAAIALLQVLLAFRSVWAAVEQEGEEATRAAARSFARAEKLEAEKLSAVADALVRVPALSLLFVQRERERLLAAARPIWSELKEEHGATDWSFVDPEPLRTCFLRVHRPELHGDVLNGAALLAAIKGDKGAFGEEQGKAGFGLRVVRPYRPEKKLLGYLEMGEDIGAVLSQVKLETGAEVGLVIEKQVLDEQLWAESRGELPNNWSDDPKTVLVRATSGDLPVSGSSEELKRASDEGRFFDQVERGGRYFARGAVAVRDAAGQKIGGLIVMSDVSAFRRRALAEQLGAGIWAVLSALIALVVAGAMMEFLVFRRLDQMRRTLEDTATRLAGGDYAVGQALRAQNDDEIGRHEAFMGGFLTMVGRTLSELEKRLNRSA